MNILYIDNSPWWGGAEACLKGYSYDQKMNGWSISVCAPFPSPHLAQYEIESSCFVYRNTKKRFWMTETHNAPLRGLDRLDKLLRAKQLGELLKVKKPDVVYFNLYNPRDIWDVKAARQFGCKIVMHVRSLFHQVLFSKDVFDFVDLVVGVSDIVCKQVRDTGTTTRVVRIYDGVDTATGRIHNRKVVRREFNIPENRVVAVFPAVIDPRKGQDLAIEAFGQLVDDYPMCQLVIVGGCPDLFRTYGDRLKKMAEVHPKNIRFIGHQKDMNKLYCMADFVLALSHDGEAYGRIPVEAGGHGLPVVATRAGATPDIVVDNETGFLVEPGSVNEVILAVKEMLVSEKRIALGVDARERIRTHFNRDDGHRQVREALLSLFA